VIVLASHLPGEGHFRSKQFKVRSVCCHNDYDYWRGVAEYWASGSMIVNVEHDMAVTDSHIQQLLDCPHALCSWAYLCHWITTGLPHDIYAAGTGLRNRDTHPDPLHLQGGEEWANWSAIGLVKITPQARVGVLRREPWAQLELAVHDAVRRPWHMHWNPSLTHHHW
jgi:hypothetical protein